MNIDAIRENIERLAAGPVGEWDTLLLQYTRPLIAEIDALRADLAALRMDRDGLANVLNWECRHRRIAERALQLAAEELSSYAENTGHAPAELYSDLIEQAQEEE